MEKGKRASRALGEPIPTPLALRGPGPGPGPGDQGAVQETGSPLRTRANQDRRAGGRTKLKVMSLS